MKAIETRYKGYRFRSRTEARWAVFFETLGLKWEYEAQGYVLPRCGTYLPDFKLNLPTEIVYCEVKSAETDEHEGMHVEALRELADESGCRVLLLTGVPGLRAYNQFVPGLDASSFTAAFFQDYAPYVNTADDYWFQSIRVDPDTGWLLFGHDERGARKSFGKRFVVAVDAAKSARFEHGETP